MSQDLPQTQLFIGGQECPAEGQATYDLFNPARPNEHVGRAAFGSVADMDRAVRAAHDAFPAWAALDYVERAAFLRKIARDLLGDHEETTRLARLFTREHGKILFETRLELSRIGNRFDEVADYADRLAQDEEIRSAQFETIVTRQPRGVAGLVVPWNWPLAILGAKLPQALLAGNTVVVKPAQSSSLVIAMILRRIAELLPPGVVNLVTGSSGRIGDALVGHPLVRMVNFTGSVDVGRHVMQVAARNITPVTLELGGNDAGLVLEDAELNDAALLRMWLAAFMSTGQICMALKRLYVHRSRFDEVVAGLTAIGRRQVIGDGLLPDTTMGPLNNHKQQQVVRGMVDQARNHGSRILDLGEVPDEALFKTGYFLRPTLVIDPDPALSVVRDEQFGPTLPVLPFDTEDQAVAMANDSDFGLCSSVWSPDLDRARAIARRLEAGYTYINNHGAAAQDGRGPFGGFKHSGIGRNFGYEGVTQFQGLHSISIPAG
ncbi:aldehyde dehydrogenase family protein [Paracoccus sp. (in: a-proteobacteria)]|uniref:aldehyde dehydrogenase family protein n=1 Tax=Paracoccus sp. TaxID=267 RepID=UPI003A85D76D